MPRRRGERRRVGDAAGRARGRRELGLRDAEDAAVARQPEVPAPVLDDALRGVVEDAFLLPVGREAAVAEAARGPPRVANQ